MIREVDNYQELLNFLEKVPKDKLVVLDCYALWCGPCKSIAPFIQQLNDEYEDVFFVKTDIEKAEDITNEFEITSMPTFIFIKNYSAVDKLEGASHSTLRSRIETYM